jgi:hypothetical protein
MYLQFVLNDKFSFNDFYPMGISKEKNLIVLHLFLSSTPVNYEP